MAHSFGPVARRSLSDHVFADLRGAILSGRFDPGGSLPPERLLAQSFAVNRHAVREAVKRLQEAGLVTVVHGGGTRVNDLRRTAGLDLLAHLAVSGVADEPSRTIVRDGLEMRRCIGVEAARLAAERADAPARRRIVAAATAYGVVPVTGGAPADGVDRAFWGEVVDASGNLAFRLALNSLLHAVDANPEVTGELFAADRDDVEPHAPLAAAIASRDVEAAGDRAQAILSQAVAAHARLGRRSARRQPKGA